MGRPSAVTAEIDRLRAAMRAHPCHGCADRELHARQAERAHRASRDLAAVTERIENRTTGVGRTFDRVVRLLTDLGYLDGDTVTRPGARLARLWTECDLLVAECLRRGAWAQLGPAELAAVASCVLYEGRGPDEVEEPDLWLPTQALRDAAAATQRIRDDLARREAAAGLPQTREPDLRLARAMWRWAGGASIGPVLEESELSAGDFVRWTRQVADLLDQVSGVGGAEAAVASVARSRLQRGVVALGPSAAA